MTTSIPYIILGILWLVYVFLHSVLAASKVKSAIQKAFKMKQTAYRLLYNVFAFAGLAVIVWYQLRITPLVIIPGSALLTVLSILLLATGLIIMAICIIKYFKNLSGLQDEPNELMVTGLHRYVRHPLYLGTFIMLLGLFTLYPYLSVLIMDVIIIAYTLIALRWEEAKLVKEFGEGYRKYQQQVPAIIPGF